MADKLKITLVKSPIGAIPKQKAGFIGFKGSVGWRLSVL